MQFSSHRVLSLIVILGLSSTACDFSQSREKTTESKPKTTDFIQKWNNEASELIKAVNINVDNDRSDSTLGEKSILMFYLNGLKIQSFSIEKQDTAEISPDLNFYTIQFYNQNQLKGIVGVNAKSGDVKSLSIFSNSVPVPQVLINESPLNGTVDQSLLASHISTNRLFRVTALLSGEPDEGAVADSWIKNRGQYENPRIKLKGNPTLGNVNIEFKKQ